MWFGGFFFAIRRRHTRCALVTGVQTCALPIYPDFLLSVAKLRVGWSQVNRSATMDSFDDRPGHIWYDGALVPWKDATLHVLSHALHYASCVFEGERVYNGRIFKLTEHTERLVAGARTMDFEIRSEEQTSELQSLMTNSYPAFCLQ